MLCSIAVDKKCRHECAYVIVGLLGPALACDYLYLKVSMYVYYCCVPIVVFSAVEILMQYGIHKAVSFIKRVQVVVVVVVVVCERESCGHDQLRGTFVLANECSGGH